MALTIQKLFNREQVVVYGYRKLGCKTYFYVGTTNEHPEVRAKRHLRQAKKGIHENKKLAALLLENNFQVDILEVCWQNNRYRKEYEWIVKLSKARHKLVNSRNPLSPRQALVLNSNSKKKSKKEKAA